MSYVNVESTVNGVHPKTKAALKRALAEAPETVRFDSTSAFTPGSWSGVEVPAGVNLSVVGPHAYDRKWYGTVSVAARTGRVTCV